MQIRAFILVPFFIAAWFLGRFTMQQGHVAPKTVIALNCTPVCSGPARPIALQPGKYSLDQHYAGMAEMVLIPGGSFEMGSEEFEDSKPLHTVTVSPFWMDEHEVTNGQFASFVKATSYITVAERPLDPKDYPGVPVEKLVPGSAVFVSPGHEVSLNDPFQWWKYVHGACWKQPKGPGSSIEGKENEPWFRFVLRMR